MKITLQDIAKDTGYSLSTVSRVLSGSDKYAEGTRQTVIEAARRLNYPGMRIRSVSMPKSHLRIALITDFHEGEFYSSYFYGFVQAAATLNIRISLISTNDTDEIMKDHIGLFSDQYFDGAIIFIPALNREDYELIARDIPEHFPVVSNALIESPVLTTITFDGYSGGHMAANHFRKKGYRRVGVVKGPVSKAESRFRYNGFTDFVHHAKDLDLVFETSGDFNYDSGFEAFRQMVESGSNPEAVFVTGDLMCHGFIEAAHSYGYKIPSQIAVLGYDDLPMCVHSHPLISSVKTDFETLALTTLKTLKDKKLNPGATIGLLSLVPVSLMEREST